MDLGMAASANTSAPRDRSKGTMATSQICPTHSAFPEVLIESEMVYRKRYCLVTIPGQICEADLVGHRFGIHGSAAEYPIDVAVAGSYNLSYVKYSTINPLLAVMRYAGSGCGIGCRRKKQTMSRNDTVRQQSIGAAIYVVSALTGS